MFRYLDDNQTQLGSAVAAVAGILFRHITFQKKVAQDNLFQKRCNSHVQISERARLSASAQLFCTIFNYITKITLYRLNKITSQLAVCTHSKVPIMTLRIL